MSKRLSKQELEQAKELRKNAVAFIQNFYHPDYRRPDKTFGEIGEPWQYRYFIEPYFNPKIDRMYIETGRDFDKTGLMGACACAESIVSPIPLKTRVHGADKEQAKIVLDAIRDKIIAHNKDLTISEEIIDEKNILKFKNGSLITNEATEAQGATGKRINRLIFEELHTCQKDTDRELWNVLDTKGDTKIVINTNAGGKKQGLCWDVRTSLKEKFLNGQDNVFFFSAESNPWLPSWLNEADVRSRESVPESVFRRFHLCHWGDGGDVFTEEQIQRAMRKDDLRYVDTLADIPVSFALDYGPKWNWTALAGCYGMPDGIYKIHSKIWRPSGTVIQVQDIEDYIENVIMQSFIMKRLDIETYQMISTIQKLIRLYGAEIVKEWTPTEQSVVAISKNIFQLISNFRFFYPATDTDFTSELRNAELAPASGRNGTQKDDYKIMFRDLGSEGHGDDFRATAIAALHCTQTFSRPLAEIAAGILVGQSEITSDTLSILGESESIAKTTVSDVFNSMFSSGRPRDDAELCIL